MAKAPASQFYWGDLRRDPEYHMMSWSARGIWIEMLCCMHFSTERGKLEGTKEEIARMIGCTNGDFENALKEIESTKTANVTFSSRVTDSSKIVTVINRRMFREEKERESHALRQQRYREKIKSDGKMTPPSSSSSSSSTTKNKTYSSFFLSFWNEYPKKVGKPNAFKEWNKIKPDLELVLNALRAQIEHKEKLILENKFCAEWPDPERWIKNRRWEDEIIETASTDPFDQKMADIDRAMKERKHEHPKSS